MKRRKSPRVKKQDEYEKDHRTHMENPHAFRKNWPKKKARVNRRDRVKVRSLLARADADELTRAHVKSVTGGHDVFKTGVLTLRQWVRRDNPRSLLPAGAYRDVH